MPVWGRIAQDKNKIRISEVRPIADIENAGPRNCRRYYSWFVCKLHMSFALDRLEKLPAIHLLHYANVAHTADLMFGVQA
jgi:hypothetical protein